MDKLKLLYQSYLDKGLISEKTSFDQFSSASPKQLMSLYSLGIENNLISQKTELDTFSSAWYPEKKKDLSEVSALQSLEGPSASDTSPSFISKGEAPLDTKVPEAFKTEVSTPKFEPTKAVPKQEVTTEDWWADKWNGLIEGFQTFASNVSDENNMNGDAIADFIQDNKTKKPELFASFNESLKLLKAKGYDDISGRGMAANIAYTNFWNKDNNIENEVLPYIRRKGREKAIENFGVQINEKVQKELGDRFFSSAVRGLATSTPAMLTSASTMGMSFFNMSYNNAEEQLAMQLAENPDLNMTSGEKETYKIANAGIEAVLERIGLSNALKGNPMLKRAITGKVLTTLTQTGGNIGAEAFEKIVKQEVKGLSGYARKVAAGSISEFETGALQQLSNDLINQYVTDSQGRNVFSPKTAKEIAGDVIYAGAQEAVGGGIISGVVAPFQKSALEMTKEDFDSGIDFAKNVNVDKASEYLNKQVDAGKISRQEADATLSRMQEFRNSANKLPDDVDSKTQYELFQLIAEKQKIQKSVAGKDDAIQETAKPKIDAINEKIQQIYEGGKEAVATTPEATVETVEVAEAAPVAAVEDQAKQSLKQRTKEELATLNELELEEYNQLRRSIIKDITELSITDGEQEREGIRNKITNSIEKYNNLFEKDDRQEEAGIPSPIVEGEAPIEAQPIEGASQETPEAGGVLQVPIEEGVEEVIPTAIEEAPVGVTEEVKTSQPEPNKRFEEEKKRLQTEIIRLQEIQVDEISRIRQAIIDVQGTDKLAKINGTVVNEGTIERIYDYYDPLIADLENELRDLLKSSKPAEETKVSPVAEPVAEVVTPIAEPTAEVEATTAVSEEETELIADIELDENKIEDLKEEIQSEKGNIKEELERLRGEIVNVRAKKLPADEKRELIEELKGEIQGAKDDNESLIDLYKQDINALKADIRKAQKKLDKIREKKTTAAPVAVPVAKRPVVEAVDISAENFAESFPSLFSFLKSGAVYRSGLSDSAGKKKELAKDRIKVDSLLKSAKVGLRDAKILIAVMSDYKPKKMADIAEFNRAYIEAENLLAKLEKLNKGNTPNTSSTKAEAIAKINSSNRLNQKQKEVMVTVVNSLKAEQLFILDLDIDEDGYGFANNLLTSKSAYSFIHEVGHWAYYNLLSAKDRIDYMDYMSEKFLNNEFTGLVYPVEGLATNAMDSYQEYFANQFDQWYTNQAGAENVLRTMFIKLKDIVDNLIKLFQSKGYNPDLIKYFDNIVDTTKFNMVPDKINQMDNKLINDEQLESESFGNSNELAREVVSQEKVEELDIKLETMLDKAKKAWVSMWWNKDQGQIKVFKEQQESLVWLEKRKIKAFNNRLNDLLKGADKETIRIAFDLLSGKAEPEQISILEKKKNGSLIFGHVNLQRNYIDSLTESILFSPSFSKLPPTTQDAMIDNMGTYLRGSYRFWKDKNFFPSKELQTKAVQEVFDVKYSKEFARLVSLFDTKGLSDKVLSLENLYNQIKQNIIEEEKLLEVGQKTSEMKAMESNLSEIGKELSSERKNLKDQASLMKKLVGSSELTPENIKAFEAMKDDYIAESMASESNKLKAEARDEVKAYLEESKKLRESNDFKSGKLSSSSIKIPSQEFKRKKELLPSIKALLGEEKDPIIKFSDTAVALANIKHKGDMVYKISRAFKGKELIKNEATKSEIATGEYRIVTDKFSPLNGKYISRQVFDAITDPDIYAADHWFANLYFDTLKFSRKSKTIWNPPGWGKNLRGGWFTMMANGVVNINVLRDLKRRGELLFNDMSDEETEQLIIEAANKGLMGQSVDANLIGGINLIYSRSVDGEDTDIDTLTNYVGKKLQKGKAQVIGFDNWLSRKYGAIDDYTKLVIYRAEKLSFAKKLYGKDYKDLTADQQNEVMDAAAETVKRTTPTWSRLPPAYFKIAKTPFGDFLGFDFESIRSFIANFATGYSDLQKAATSKSLSKAQRDEYLKAGSRRLAGTAMVYGLGMAVTELIQQLMLGDDDELAEDLNSLAPDWAAGHKLVFTGINKDGIATFYDYTLEDPYAKMFDLTTGKYGLNRLVADYLSPNMAIGTIYNMTQGMDHYGRPISNSYDPLYIRAAKTFGYGAMETFIPPYVSSNIRDEVRESQLSKEQYNPLDAIGRVSSRAFIRDYKTNIGQQMYFTIKAFATKKEDYTDLSGMSRANRLRELDEIKRMYKAIGNVAMAKENYALYSDATKNIERYFNTPEKWYILYDYELPEEK